jgi:hypothetical protein
MIIKRAVDIAIDNVLKEGLTDIFSRPFEVDFLKNNAFRKVIHAIVCNALNGHNLQGLAVYPIAKVLYPKNNVFDFRSCALMQPLDTIKYTSLVMLAAEEIEKARIPKNKKVVFSYRVKPQKGYIFDYNANLTSFRNEAIRRSKLKKVKVIAKCDIANFYDRINLHRLESILLSLKLDQWIVKLINELLLFWSGRNSYSLPVGSNASRILAEACLLEVDRFLYSNKVNFIRFVDDYRFFAPDAKTAHYWITLLIERLSLEGLSLNPSKTLIEEAAAFEGIQEMKESTNKKKVRQDIPRAFVHGYGGIVPVKFREASESEKKVLSKKSGRRLLSALNAKPIIEPDEFKELCKIILYNQQWKLFLELPSLLEKFPQFFPYVTDMLIKYSDVIPVRISSAIADKLANELNKKEKLPEYIATAIVRLIGNKKFSKKDALIKYFRDLRRNAGPYIGRATIDALTEVADRGDVIEIRNCYDRADLWEKRSIIRLVYSKLTEEEQRPWLKNIKLHVAEDPFSVEIFEPKKSKKGKKKKP